MTEPVAIIVRLLLLFNVLLLSQPCLAVHGDYGIAKFPNLVRNGSFEADADFWQSGSSAPGQSAYWVRDASFGRLVNLPYWEGRPVYYRPIQGNKYLELNWSKREGGGLANGRVVQELPRLSPGSYLLVAHVRAHAGVVLADPAEFPEAAIILEDPRTGLVLHRQTIDWLPARQSWMLVASLVDIRTPRVRLALEIHLPSQGAGQAFTGKASDVSYLFDDIRLIALGSKAEETNRQFEGQSGLTFSSEGMTSRPLREDEYATDDLPTRKLSSERRRLDFTSASAWGAEPSPAVAIVDEIQADGEHAVALRKVDPDAEDPAGIAMDVRIPPQRATESRYISVSAWVKSAMPRSARLALDLNQGKRAESAFHSGSGKWVYLTVVAPYPVTGKELRVALRLEQGEARLKAPELLVTTDDRFDGALPPQDIGGGRLRERIAFKKDPHRLRIVVVGNSTVNGVAFVAHQASFPYLLQLKLESLYPGRFEVINYGVGAGGLLDQIVSIGHHFKFATEDGNYYISLINPARYETASSASLVNAAKDAMSLAALKPDIIIIASMWNDMDRLLHGQIHTRDYGALAEFLRLLDEPSIAIYSAYSNKKNLMLRQMANRDSNKDVYPLGWNRDQTYGDLSHDGLFYAAARRAEGKYEELLDTFVARATKVAWVWNLELPANGGRRSVEFADRFPDLMLEADGMPVEKRKAIVFSRQLSASIQSRVGQRVALRHGIPNLDLVSSYDALIEDGDASQWARLNYFVPDLIHFTYRGNEWIADEIFRLMEAEFEKLAKNPD